MIRTSIFAFVIAFMMTIALIGSGAFAQTVTPTTTPTDTMSPSPTTGTTAPQYGVGGGPGTSMPYQAPSTGLGGTSH